MQTQPHPTRARRVSPARSGDVTAAHPTSKKQTASPLSERDFQKQVVGLAHHCGWLVQHTYAQGSVLGSRAIDPGYPDLTLVRAGRIIIVELKTDKGRVSPQQDRWLHEIQSCGIPALVWRPRDWSEIEAILTAPQPATWPGEGGVA